MSERGVTTRGIACTCERCGKSFRLVADEGGMPGEAALCIRSCESGGVYAVYVDCLYCGHTHELR